MKQTTKGYICISDNRALILDERDNQLYFGTTATLFPTRRKANEAKERTLVASLDSPLGDWNKQFGAIVIMRLV